MEKAKLYVLSNGHMWVERGFLYHFGSQKDTGKAYEPGSFCISNCSYFIDHPAAKIILDLGFKTQDFDKLKGFPMRRNEEGLTYKQSPDENPKSQLEKIGVSIDDLDYVVISHLMLEHDAWLPLFKGKKARIIVQRKELEYAYANGNWKAAPEPFHSWMYWKEHFDHPDLNYELIEGDRLLAKDVQIISTPGHTPGYQMMKVGLEKSGTIILSPCEHRDMYYGIGVNALSPGIPHAFTYSLADELRNFRKILQTVKEENGQIFFGHDYEQFKTLKKIPQYYD